MFAISSVSSLICRSCPEDCESKLDSCRLDWHMHLGNMLNSQNVFSTLSDKRLRDKHALTLRIADISTHVSYTFFFDQSTVQACSYFGHNLESPNVNSPSFCLEAPNLLSVSPVEK